MNLSEQARQARRAYMRRWRQQNRDRVREHQRRYWENVAARQQQNAGSD